MSSFATADVVLLEFPDLELDDRPEELRLVGNVDLSMSPRLLLELELPPRPARDFEDVEEGASDEKLEGDGGDGGLLDLEVEACLCCAGDRISSTKNKRKAVPLSRPSVGLTAARDKSVRYSQQDLYQNLRMAISATRRSSLSCLTSFTLFSASSSVDGAGVAFGEPSTGPAGSVERRDEREEPEVKADKDGRASVALESGFDLRLLLDELLLFGSPSIDARREAISGLFATGSPAKETDFLADSESKKGLDSSTYKKDGTHCHLGAIARRTRFYFYPCLSRSRAPAQKRHLLC